jgi:hypothetical protein
MLKSFIIPCLIRKVKHDCGKVSGRGRGRGSGSGSEVDVDLDLERGYFSAVSEGHLSPCDGLACAATLTEQ